MYAYLLLLHPQLFEERDAELDRNDRQIAEMTAAAAQRDATIAELRADLGTAQGRLEGERSKLADLETFYSEQLRALKEAIEAARRSRDDEAKRWRSEMEAQRAELESRARSREAEWEAQRREMTESADAAIAAMQRESRRREDDALQAVRRCAGPLRASLSAYSRSCAHVRRFESRATACHMQISRRTRRGCCWRRRPPRSSRRAARCRAPNGAWQNSKGPSPSSDRTLSSATQPCLLVRERSCCLAASAAETRPPAPCLRRALCNPGEPPAAPGTV